jgi:uncharacterized membrane protein
MSDSLPPPGFYEDPETPGKKRWWDGTAWTDVAKDSSTMPDLGSLAGGALLADGIVGFGKNRQGILGSFFGIFIGIALAVVSVIFLVPALAAQGDIEDAVSTQATVVAVERLINKSDSTDRSSTSTLTCAVVVQYTTREGQSVETTTPYTSSSLCSFAVGQVVAISYDAKNIGRFNGLDPTGDLVGKWFPWVFVGVGVLIAVTSFWTFILRATQIGGGIYLINRSRQKDLLRLNAKKQKRIGPPAA